MQTFFPASDSLELLTAGLICICPFAYFLKTKGQRAAPLRGMRSQAFPTAPPLKDGTWLETPMALWPYGNLSWNVDKEVAGSQNLWIAWPQFFDPMAR